LHPTDWLHVKICIAGLPACANSSYGAAMKQRPHLLDVEDDIDIRSLLRDYLSRENLCV
jgi:hypothetical protein